jgi:hypothetical protein
MLEVLSNSQPGLWVEAGRAMVGRASGNVEFGLWLANRVVADPRISITDLIDTASLEGFLDAYVPEGPLFLASGALALVTRFGFEGEVSGEIDLLASGLGMAPELLRDAVHELDRRGLLVAHGRYRSVAPLPVAAHLAASAWQELGDTILTGTTFRTRRGSRRFRANADRIVATAKCGRPLCES